MHLIAQHHHTDPGQGTRRAAHVPEGASNSNLQSLLHVLIGASSQLLGPGCCCSLFQSRGGGGGARPPEPPLPVCSTGATTMSASSALRLGPVDITG